MTRGKILTAAAMVLLGTPLGAQQTAQRPLSAIEWLDQAPDTATSATGLPNPGEPPVAGRVSVPDVEVTPLDDATGGTVGLLPMSVTGLPANLWAASDASDLSALWHSATGQPMPAIQALYHTLLLAEAAPPRGDAGAYLATRAATLRRFGAVEPALELLARAGAGAPKDFPQWFDLALLHGDETEACTTLRDAPGLMNDDAAQIYCTALTGDWPTAMLLFDTAEALGELDGARASLLAQFLDAELAETAISLAPVRAPTPLEFRLYEAIGSPLPTRSLPLAYAMADLRGTMGWKAEIEAAERLTRAGALAPNRLFGLYTRQSPAASGGVWDRVAAVQALDAALNKGDGAAIAAALGAARDQLGAIGLDVPFAAMFGDRLMAAKLPQDARTLAFHIALLTPDYEAAAVTPPAGRAAAFLAGLAEGHPDPAQASEPRERIIAEAFAAPPRPAPGHARLIAQGKLGEAILSAALQFDRADGDPGEMASAIATLRAVGLEDTARRAALQALLLERPE